VLGSWLDSIPVIIISGQVNKEMTSNYTELPLRQLGDQEFNIVESVKNMTKYAVQVNDVSEIKYHLETGHRGVCCNPCNWDGRNWMPTMVGHP
jgi:acetolactate synthase-1/2/3 large subunit